MTTFAPARPGRHAARPRMRPTDIALVVVVLVVGLLAAWSFLRPDPHPLGDPVAYPNTPPAEWSPAATWSSPPLLPGVPPAVVGEDRVAIITDDHSLLLIETGQGRTAWSTPVPDGPVKTPPTTTRIDGADVVAAHIGDALVWWDLESGERDQLELVPDGAVTFLGTSPLVTLGEGQVAAVLDPQELTPLTVPPGAWAIAAHEDGQVTAASSAGWWHLGPNGPQSGAWESSGATPTVAGYTDGVLLLLRPGSPAVLELHSDRLSDVRFVLSAPVVLDTEQVTWNAAPTGGWGILGRAVVDLQSGAITDLGAWSTRSVLADRAYGHVDGQPVVVGPDLPRGLLAPGEAMPAAITSSGALVFGPAAGTAGGVDPRRVENVLYHLPPRERSS
ncbi:MAG: hypothetical protein Q4G43_04865 [Mobilicoccus sp.]|nr:hypothetical protein [Mobilicoccus sp.]